MRKTVARLCALFLCFCLCLAPVGALAQDADEGQPQNEPVLVTGFEPFAEGGDSVSVAYGTAAGGHSVPRPGGQRRHADRGRYLGGPGHKPPRRGL